MHKLTPVSLGLSLTDHKRRKLDSHASPSHSSSVKVSMAWGRLCQFLLYLPERSLPLHIPAAQKINKGELSHTEIPTIAMGVGKHSMDIRMIFCRIGRDLLKDLAKKILCILSIFILKYLPIFILMKAISVPWEERNFLSISIFHVEFFVFLFLRIILTWRKKKACQIKSAP